ncbi:MAG: phosphoadenylyl-sulfate reductase [Pseudomonadota bacterium]
MSPEDRVRKIHERLQSYCERGLRLFVTSSFQTQSIPLLHIVSRFDQAIPVYFLDTGFHFPETRAFRDAVSERLGLNLVSVESPVPKSGQRDLNGRFLFTSNPDLCCYYNKVLPMDPVLESHDVWIAGVRGDQTAFRKSLQEEVPGRHGTVKYHPMLGWTGKMIWEYRVQHGLPEHPLEAEGFLSVGCSPCTRRWEDAVGGRKGRWTGMQKEECGLHTELAEPE